MISTTESKRTDAGPATPRRVMSSPYMTWAKTRQRAKYNLAASGIRNLPIEALGVHLSQLEITGESGDAYLPLSRAIAERYGVPEESIVTTLGTSMANHLAMAALVSPGDEVLIEHPTYELLLSTARYLGASVRRFRRSFGSGFAVDTDRLASAITKRTRLIILTNLHNPSGALLEAEELRAIGSLARRVNAHVLVDEVYLDGAFEDAPRTSLLLGREFLVTSSLTKVYGLSGLRSGWILAPKAIARRIWRLKDLFYGSSPHPTERLSVLAFSRLQEIGRESRELIGRNRRITDEFFMRHSELRVIPKSFGTVLFPKLQDGSVKELCEVLREHYQTTVVPGRYFGMPRHFRIGIGCESATLREGLRRLDLALGDGFKRKIMNRTGERS